MDTAGRPGRSVCGYWPLRIGVWVFRRHLIPLEVAWLGAAMLSATWTLLAGRTRRRLEQYWRRLRPQADGWELAACVWRHLIAFGQVVADRLFIYSHGNRYQITHRGLLHLESALRSGRGVLLLSAHIGHWELASRLLNRYDPPPINLVMVEGEDAAIQALVDTNMADRKPRIIDPRRSLAAAVAINEALGRGEVVGMLGDRVHPGQRGRRAWFLGRPATLPEGPLITAATTGVPLLVCFWVKTGLFRYHLDVTRPLHLRLPRRGPARAAYLDRAVAWWARRLEIQVRRHPFHWNNFYDFWE